MPLASTAVGTARRYDGDGRFRHGASGKRILPPNSCKRRSPLAGPTMSIASSEVRNRPIFRRRGRELRCLPGLRPPQWRDVLQSSNREPLGPSMPIARRLDPARGRGSSLRLFSGNERAPRWRTWLAPLAATVVSTWCRAWCIAVRSFASSLSTARTRTSNGSRADVHMHIHVFAC